MTSKYLFDRAKSQLRLFLWTVQSPSHFNILDSKNSMMTTKYVFIGTKSNLL